MTEGKVLIGVPTRGLTQHSKFYDYVDMLMKMKNTQKMYAHGASPARNRNDIIAFAIKEDFTHILFLDDDVAVPSDALLRLINHDKDMVSGLYLMRNYPHRPIAFDEARPDGACKFVELSEWNFVGSHPNEGQKLIPLVAAGLGCCLIKTEVFRATERPWITLGECNQEDWDDDITFFMKARKNGFELFLDTEVKCGHMASAMIIPNLIDGKWHVSYDTIGSKAVTFPLEPIQELVEQ